jgi:CMP-N-acetylneuraminic acid synthetase
MLQVTSPLRTLETTRKVITKGVEGEFDTVATVVENREYFRTFRNGVWEPVVPNAPRRQQEREPFFAEVGVCYIMNVAKLKETKQIFARQKEDFVIVDAIEATDINVPMDLEFVRFLKTKGY